LITERPTRFVFRRTVVERVRRYMYMYIYGRFESRFDWNANGRFAGPYIVIRRWRIFRLHVVFESFV